MVGTTTYMTPEEYLAREQVAETKSEYWGGQARAMVGASEPHNSISVNVTVSLGSQLKGRPCKVYANDMRVKVTAVGLYTYPDVVVVCGEPQIERILGHTLLNPTLIVEVLSESTAAYDRGEKFGFYQRLDSLAEYVLVAQDRPRVEQYLRQPDGRWLYACAEGLEAALELPSIGCTLTLVEVYDKVSLP